jgi:hypothetical protein
VDFHHPPGLELRELPHLNKAHKRVVGQVPDLPEKPWQVGDLPHAKPS